jgi:hypothetical protein
MVEVPKRSDIQTVFAMNEPQHMLSKLIWEIQRLTDAMSVWNDKFPEPIFMAFNTAVTAWHITDWLWQSSPKTREVLATRFKLTFNEGARSSLRKGLERFQDAIVADSRPLYICREVANASKHMRKARVDPDVKAVANWDPVVERAGLVKPGDLVMSLWISDGDDRRDAVFWFIEAYGYWETLFSREKLISREAMLPDRRIIGSN